ncbi:MAG: sigma-54-dependent Fis family transcriptional regulator [Deltaproteobacteria bacterium]|nr:sigma-54-dependent Fis family transcriptional regulator [Deltaproteobacteria bacterium]
MADIVLVVDDEPSNRQVLLRILEREGHRVEETSSGREALDRIRQGGVALCLSDLRMPGMDGLELLRAARALDPEVEFIVMTAYGTVESAVDAMKEGAYDFITKPLRRVELVTTVRKALEKQRLARENRSLRARLEDEDAVVGHSTAMRRVLEEIEQVAPSEAAVLLEGESGTGKGLLARRIHALSVRSGRRMITVNCAAIPETLLESELFGYEPGAFTGARGRKEGRFDLASGGTLFLDEVTEMPAAVQVKLLRVLQDGEYERVGGTRTLRTDCRILSATNRDLDRAVAEGRFREDLFWRLDVIRVRVPPLRERAEDVPLLVQHMLAGSIRKNRKPLEGISPEALDALASYHWPGNVRELENVVERAVVLARGRVVEVHDLPEGVRQGRGAAQVVAFRVGTPLKTVERRLIEETLRFAGGDRALAASLLGITSRTIYRREAEWRGEGPEEDPTTPPGPPPKKATGEA